MKNLQILIINDFKNIFRDNILKILLFVPLLMIVILQLGLPHLLRAAPEVSEYKFLLVTGFCLVIASFPSFIISFIMLDEKDEGIFVIYKALPISALKFFTYRLGFILVFSWFFSFLLLLLQKVSGFSPWQLLLVSLLFSLLPPVLCLLTVTIARNKIEGMSLMKLLNFIIFIPMVAFFIDAPWKYFFEIIPVYWSYKVMETAGQTGFAFSLIDGIMLHLIVIFITFRKFKNQA